MTDGVIAAAWIQGLCTFIPTTALALAAVWGVRAWRPQAQGQRAIERAEDCLVALHEVVDLTRAARAHGFRAAPEDIDTPEKMRGTSARIRDEALQRAWQSWQRFAAVYRRAGFFISLPEPDAAYDISRALAELSGLARLIDTYESFEDDLTSHGLRLRQEAVTLRAQFMGFAEDGVTENPTDLIERKLASTLESLRAVLLSHTGPRKSKLGHARTPS